MTTTTDIFRPATCDGLTAVPSRDDGSRRRGSAPDTRSLHIGADIAAEDWDLLFRAALNLLTRVAVEKDDPGSIGALLQAPGTTLRECIDALDQLRRSLPTRRWTGES
jgi:hypothetical protein